MRDLKADLALCEKATPGPWTCCTNRHPTTSGFSFGWIEGPIENWCWTDEWRSSRNDAKFVAAAREGWPEAIRRAMAAEKERDELRAALQEMASIAKKAIRRSGALPSDDEWFALTKASQALKG